MSYPHNEAIKDAVKTCSPDVINGGLNYLIPGYRRDVERIDNETTIYDYLDNMDGRDIIGRILSVLNSKERSPVDVELAELDNLLKLKTIELKNCIWGERAEKDGNLNREKNWWYYRAPKWLIEEENLEIL